MGCSRNRFAIIYRRIHIRGYPVHIFFRKYIFEMKNGVGKIKF